VPFFEVTGATQNGFALGASHHCRPLLALNVDLTMGQVIPSPESTLTAQRTRVVISPACARAAARGRQEKLQYPGHAILKSGILRKRFVLWRIDQPLGAGIPLA
jgi:hypothetical protein